MKQDIDLKRMTNVELRREVMKLRHAIRRHRDERGNGRCWLDDGRLYQILPEQKQADQTLPPRNEFLGNCGKYWTRRQKNGGCK